MVVDIYMLKWLAEARLAEARAQSARQALLRSIGSARTPMRTAVAAALIRAGRWLRRRERPARRGGRLAPLDAR
jgi:hypothetical protein